MKPGKNSDPSSFEFPASGAGKPEEAEALLRQMEAQLEVRRQALQARQNSPNRRRAILLLVMLLGALLLIGGLYFVADQLSRGPGNASFGPTEAPPAEQPAP